MLRYQFLASWLLNASVHCSKFLLHTKKHFADTNDSDTDFDLFLDFDLAILGTESTDRYNIYADQIRQEYIHVPKDIYCVERPKILRGFLQHPRLYRTDAFHTTHESRARANVLAEIERLTTQQQ